jgi:hypothetical protein
MPKLLFGRWLLGAVFFDPARHKFELLRSHPKIPAERVIQDEDREDYEGDAPVSAATATTCSHLAFIPTK